MYLCGVKEIKPQTQRTMASKKNIYGGNSGYEGYSMSVRAREAREAGKFPKGDFCKEYKVSPSALETLVKAGMVTDSEWHHTSSWGNRTTFYAWANDWARECGMGATKRTASDAVARYNSAEAEAAWEAIREEIEAARAEARAAEIAQRKALNAARFKDFQAAAEALPSALVIPIHTDAGELYCHVEAKRCGRYWELRTADTQGKGVREDKSYGWIKARAQEYIEKNYPAPKHP